MRNRKSNVPWIVGWLAAATTLAAQQTPVGFDAAEGVIDGKKAVGFWIKDRLDDDAPLLDPTGFEVRLTPADDLDRELVYPCGEWFAPPVGRYRVLVEGRGMISPTITLLSYGGTPFEGQGIAGLALVVPAGKVVVPESLPLGPSVSVRLLHLESHILHSDYLQRAMSRRASAAEARQGVSMPRGPVFVGLFDNARGEYTALARPVEVPAGGTVAVEPRPPAPGTSDLMAILQRPLPVGERAADDVTISWAGRDAAPREPDVLVRTTNVLYAIWYGLRREGRLEVTSPTVFFGPHPLDLQPGKVHRVLDRLEESPLTESASR